MEPILLKTTEEAKGKRLDAFLADSTEELTRSAAAQLIETGGVLVDGRTAVKSLRLSGGETVELTLPEPEPIDAVPQNIPLDVVYEDEDVIVVNKPAGLVVHPAPGHPDGTLVNALLHHCPGLSGIGGVARPGIVHRLDQDTSGVMVVAKSQRAMDVLTREFASHANIRKTYLALVHGSPSPLEGRIENLIGRCPFDRKKMAVVERNGKIAVTNYRVERALASLSLVHCQIETGRTHQIRVHMATALGCPIVGDAVYGRPGWDKKLVPIPRRQLLHAWRLELKHPVTRQSLLLEAPVPEDLNRYSVGQHR